MKQKTLTLKQLYKVGTVKLAEEGIEEFSLDAWYLLEYVTGVSKAMYFAEPERAVSEENADRYIRLYQTARSAYSIAAYYG